MKYAIRDSYYWFDTHDYIDHHTTGWVKSFFYDNKSGPVFRVTHTEFLNEALLLDDPIKAASIANALSSPPKCPTSIIQVTDKEIFAAKLQGK